MADVVVEDGTGLANADSYASVAEANARHTALANAAWDDVDDKDAALRNATDYMVNTYRLRWKGYRATSTQALDWPRAEVAKPDYMGGYGGYPNYYSNTEIPVEIKNACIDLALRAGADGGTELAPDIERTERKVKVGPIEVEYDPNAAAATIYRPVDAKLRPFLSGGSGMTRLVRA